MPSTISTRRKIALGATRGAPTRRKTAGKNELAELTLRKWGPNVLTVREEQIFRALFVAKG